MEQISFQDLGLDEKTLAVLSKKGFEEPTPIQALAIPRLLKPGPDLIAKARTGTGKTAAFGLPLVELLRDPGQKPRALILVPTRELALQVCAEIASLRSSDRPRVAPVYGGQSMGEQLRRLAAGVDIVVGTPGRVLDHIGRKSLDLSVLQYLILDEADEMLDMGFIEDIDTIIAACAPERRVMLFSATMPAGVLRIAKRHLKDYETIEDGSESLDKELTEQLWLEVRESDKLEALCRIIDMEEDFYGLVFSSTKVDADRIGKALEERGYPVETLHGDFAQDRRERIMSRFKSGKARILVATDVAARGIDVERLTHVVNWSLPHDPESYVHRIGRTGRAGNEGTAVTFVTPAEYRKLVRMREAAGATIKKARVPKVEDLMAARRARAVSKVAEAIPLVAEDSPWLALADEVMKDREPRVALAATLSLALESQLDESRYGQMEEFEIDRDRGASDRPGRWVDAAGQTKLFVAAGRKDGMGRRELAEILMELSGLPNRMIEGVEVYEAFSLASVPFAAAERVIREARTRGGFPHVRVAHESPDAPGRRQPPRGEDKPWNHAARPKPYADKRKPYAQKKGPWKPRPDGD